MKGIHRKSIKLAGAILTLGFCCGITLSAQNQLSTINPIQESQHNLSLNGNHYQPVQKEKIMPFKLMQLPYSKDALAPYISKETLEYHYGKHHQGYVNKLNALIDGTPLANKSLDDLIKNESGNIFNNAAQIWNHNFYWHCLTQANSNKPEGSLLKAIDKKFGSFDEFKKQFKEKASSNFGSGWTWLVKDKNDDLEIVNTGNAGNPMTEGKTPLLICDVWEHAYYIDYRNERGTYLDNFWHIVNWKFVEKNYEK